MAKTVTYGNIKYNCKDLKSYNVKHINRKTDEEIIELYKPVIISYFDRNNLEDEVIIKLGRIITDKAGRGGDLPRAEMEKFEELDKLMIGTVPGERMECFYQVFDPLKFRQMKINKILNVK